MKSQEQTSEYSSIAGVKRPHSTDACIGEGVSPKKPALSNDRESSDFLYLPADPQMWSSKDVVRWLDWAVQEYGFNPVNMANFPFTGAQLCQLTREEFVERAPPYTGDVLYSHLTILRARSATLGKPEDNSGVENKGLMSPGFGMGWPYRWPSSMGDFSHFMMPPPLLANSMALGLPYPLPSHTPRNPFRDLTLDQLGTDWSYAAAMQHLLQS